MTISEGLKRFRKQYRVTQKQAAIVCGITEQAYQKYEYGTIAPIAQNLVALADYFDVSLDYLVGRSDDPKRH